MNHLATIKKNAREELRISIDEFKGQTLCNLRIWYEDGNEYHPGKQGLALRLALLPDLIAALQKAQKGGGA